MKKTKNKINKKPKQSSRGVLKKRCSENIQLIYTRTSMPKCHFNKVALQLYRSCTSAWVFCSKFATYFHHLLLKNTSERLLVKKSKPRVKITVAVFTFLLRLKSPVFAVLGHTTSKFSDVVGG